MLYSLGTIKAVNRNDRFTSTPVVPFAQIADIRRRLGVGPNHPELSFAPAAKFGRSWPEGD